MKQPKSGAKIGPQGPKKPSVKKSSHTFETGPNSGAKIGPQGPKSPSLKRSSHTLEIGPKSGAKIPSVKKSSDYGSSLKCEYTGETDANGRKSRRCKMSRDYIEAGKCKWLMDIRDQMNQDQNYQDYY